MMMNMNPMMMGMHAPMRPMQPAPNMPFNPYMHPPPPPNMQMTQPPNAPFMPPPPQNGMYPTYPPQPQHPQTMQMPQAQLPAPLPPQQQAVAAVPVAVADNSTNNGHLNGVNKDESKECAKEAVVGNHNAENVVSLATKKNKKYILLYDDEMVSMEEQRFAHSDYHWTPKQVMEGSEKNQEGDVEMDKNKNENEDVDLYHKV